MLLVPFVVALLTLTSDSVANHVRKARRKKAPSSRAREKLAARSASRHFSNVCFPASRRVDEAYHPDCVIPAIKHGREM